MCLATRNADCDLVGCRSARLMEVVIGSRGGPRVTRWEEFLEVGAYYFVCSGKYWKMSK